MKISCCGLDCETCDAYVVTQADVDKAERTAELADNEAGRQVGQALKQFLNEQITEETLRRQLLDILAERV